MHERWRMVCDEITKASRRDKEPPKPFRIFDLPREVRNRIYGYVLHGSVDGTLRQHTITITRNRWRVLDCTPGLLLVNRQIYDEALPFLYTSRIFEFWEALCIGPWLGYRSARGRQSIHHMRFLLDMDVMNRAKLPVEQAEHHLLITSWEEFTYMCQYVSKELKLQSLEIEFTGTPDIVCENFHQDFWAKSLYRITNLERLSIVTRKKVTIDPNSVSFMKAKMEKPHPSSATSPLLSLPVELRWKIYENLLVSRLTSYHKVWFVKDHAKRSAYVPSRDLQSQRIPYDPPFSLAPDCHPDIHPEILATCKHVQMEATAMLYTENNMSELRGSDLSNVPVASAVGGWSQSLVVKKRRWNR